VRIRFGCGLYSIIYGTFVVFPFLLWSLPLPQFLPALFARIVWCSAALLTLVTFEQPLHKCCLICRILMGILIHDIYKTMSPPFFNTLSTCYTWDVLCWFIWIDASSPYIDQPENIDLVISSSDRLHASVLCCEVETVLLFSVKW